MTDSLTDLELLRLVATLDVRLARLVRDMANQRLRGLGAVPASPWHQKTTERLPAVCLCRPSERAVEVINLNCEAEFHVGRAEGAELQAGLEEAVRRSTADLEANPDLEVVDDFSR